MGHINDVIKLSTAPSHVFHYGDWQNMGTPDLSEGFDIYFPHETESRFHCLSSCLPSSFSRCANSLCECLECRRNTRNLELSDSCQLTLSENLQGMTGRQEASHAEFGTPTLAT